MTTQTKERTCKERVQEHWDSRKAEFQKFMNDENYDELSEYILDVSHVEARPAEDFTRFHQMSNVHLQHAPYDRIQISYGGPTEEIRYYEDGIVEFVLLDWFDSAVVVLNHQQLECTHLNQGIDYVNDHFIVHQEDEQIAEFLHEYFIGEPLEDEPVISTNKFVETEPLQGEELDKFKKWKADYTKQIIEELPAEFAKAAQLQKEQTKPWTTQQLQGAELDEYIAKRFKKD
tara:strand:+ start:235 stop:927 length:693 start_codon:yes stop_codon:yes gene_type:complete